MGIRGHRSLGSPIVKESPIVCVRRGAPSMAIEVRDFRLSFVWFETNLALLESMQGNAPYSFLGRSSTYSPKLDAANLSDAKDLQPPWPKPPGQRFCTFILRITPGPFGG